MKKLILSFLKLFVSSVFLFSCALEQTNTCEEDKKDENWDKVIDSSECTSEQKGEAYLARGGFFFFDMVSSGELDLIGSLGLTESNWEFRLADFESAVEVVRSTYQTGSSTKKSIFILGTFLSFYTYMTGKLDNGGGGGETAFDGITEAAEVESYVGTGIVDTSGDDGTLLFPTSDFQFKYKSAYYITNQPLTILYNDFNADGSGDSVIALPPADGGLMNPLNWTVLNQIVHMDSLANPLDASSSANSGEVQIFSGYMVSRLTDLENSMLALGIDASDDSIQSISELRTKIDNGGQCQILNENPALRIVEMFVSNSQEASTDDYSISNIFSITELGNLSEDTFFDSIPGITVEPGVKLLFLKPGGDYIPYWSDATDDIKLGMESLSQFDPAQVKANDGNITLSEIICASELLSE